MQEIPGILNHCPLFEGIEPKSLASLLQCLSAITKNYQKNDYIFNVDENAVSVGIVISGSVHIVQEDFWGNRTILSQIMPGGLFGESFSCALIDKYPVSVYAAEKAEILLIDYRKIITTCSSACLFHTSLIKNMLQIVADKNVLLMEKMEFITKRTTRDKLLAYLSAQALKEKSKEFDIPFNRQELADYLCIDRSAMSRELGLLQKEGVINYQKNHFRFLVEHNR